MPQATIAKTEERFDLKTCPPDGYVVVRRMTYGESLQRRDDMLRMHAGTGQDGFQVEMMNKKTALQDFGNLIVDHNLTDENGRPLNFKSAQHVLALDPRIGEEIGSYIDKLNSWEGTPEVKN